MCPINRFFRHFGTLLEWFNQLKTLLMFCPSFLLRSEFVFGYLVISPTFKCRNTISCDGSLSKLLCRFKFQITFMLSFLLLPPSSSASSHFFFSTSSSIHYIYWSFKGIFWGQWLSCSASIEGVCVLSYELFFV